LRLPGSILQGILARSALTFLRVYLGLVFLVSAWRKLEHGFAPELAQLIQRGAGASSPLWYQEFAEQIILSRVTLVASLIAWGALLVGCCLVLGLATRLAAALALLLSLNLMLAEGSWFWTASSAYPSWAIVSLAVLLGAAGRTLGLDAFLAKRWPRSPFW
jgi:uncharacterized membrane protein YphA (DoxX/SURF4 family)